MDTTYDSPTPTTLRRNSITKTHRPSSTSTSSSATTTTATSSYSSSPTSCSSSVDFELVSINAIKSTCYTSLQDILPSPATVIHSPKAYRYAANSGYEILIRDRLVKQAARAYLQPMSTSPEPDVPDGPTLFRGLWTQFSGTLRRLVTAAFDCLPLSIRI